MSTFFTPPAEPSLFVYESVELELSLTTVTIETDEMVTDDFSCPIRLHQGKTLFFDKMSIYFLKNYIYWRFHKNRNRGLMVSWIQFLICFLCKNDEAVANEFKASKGYW